MAEVGIAMDPKKRSIFGGQLAPIWALDYQLHNSATSTFLVHDFCCIRVSSVLLFSLKNSKLDNFLQTKLPWFGEKWFGIIICRMFAIKK